MMTKMKNGTTQKAFTLVEMLLAMSLGALILASLVGVLKTTYDSWNINSVRANLVQHARIAVFRIITELRYADSLITADSSGNSTLEFTTTYLVDDDAGQEIIRYYRPSGNQYIRRFVDGLPALGDILAGNPLSNEMDASMVSAFVITPLKLDGSNNLIPLDVADPLSLAVAVRINIVLVGYNNETASVESIAKLRNI